MKRLLFLPAFFFGSLAASAQGSLVSDNSVTVTSSTFFIDYLRDEKSADLFRPDMYAGMEGSPYLSEDWAYARIKLIDNRRFDSVLVKLNLFENKIHFKDNNGNERMVAVQVKEIEIRDESSKWNHTFFVSGYGDDKDVFYQVIADGKKIGCLKAMSIIKREYKVFNGPNQKKFELSDGKPCLFAQGVLYEGSKSCSSLMTAFKNDSKVASFISSNDIKCNKEKDLKKLVDYYNSY
jgi:hypothetical protein